MSPEPAAGGGPALGDAGQPGTGPAIAGRPAEAVLRAPLRAAHYRALAGMARRLPAFPADLWRYAAGGGAYPRRVEVRTPAGRVAPLLYSRHDLVTLVEAFCREDYRAGPDLRLAVDVGANIGLSALYFLTRSPQATVRCYEPVPRNVRRLRATLAGFEGRVAVEACAVGPQEGEVAFGVEPTGRYGGIGAPHPEQITVRCRDINAVLEEALAGADTIDVLKLDTEGLEAATVAAIRPDLLERVRVVYYEDPAGTPLHRDGFEHRHDFVVSRLVNQRLG